MNKKNKKDINLLIDYDMPRIPKWLYKKYLKKNDLNIGSGFSTPAYDVYITELNYLFRKATEYIKGAEIIKKNTNSCNMSFHLLTSVAFELLPKILIGYEICLKYKKKKENIISKEVIMNEIKKEMSKFGHDLELLYKKSPQITKELGIKKIKKFSNFHVCDYRIEFKNNKNVLFIKEIEAVRYGSFSRSRDTLVDCRNDHLVLDVLEKMKLFVLKKSRETYDKLL
ncbi:MAG: hypothetical protein V4439_01245 [Patescibacteria group bacterium]